MDDERKRKVISDAWDYVKGLLAGEASGHDHFHVMRVCRMAVRIAEAEHADLFIVELASLLHDVDDVKLFPETHDGLLHAVSFMERSGVDEDAIGRVVRIIGEVSFRGTDSVRPSTIEGMCVQDADRLDAIGAIGIARAFSYGGSHGRPIYDPEDEPCTDMDEREYRSRVSCTLNHFYEKLFLLRDMMNTETARRIAEGRDFFMRSFVSEFLDEWDGRL